MSQSSKMQEDKTKIYSYLNNGPEFMGSIHICLSLLVVAWLWNHIQVICKIFMWETYPKT
jgi:hypothetical protein